MTPQERLEIYKKTLDTFKTSVYGPHLCVVLMETSGLGALLRVKEMLPEIYTQKPPGAMDNYQWWPANDIESRKQALNNAINLTQKLIDNER